MSDGAAVDASPLLYLGRVRRVDLLRILDRPVVVPRQVLDELRAGDPPEPVLRAIEDADWLEVGFRADGRRPDPFLGARRG